MYTVLLQTRVTTLVEWMLLERFNVCFSSPKFSFVAVPLYPKPHKSVSLVHVSKIHALCAALEASVSFPKL
jgi:hypothetical protein